jgi:hypothetical protein
VRQTLTRDAASVLLCIALLVILTVSLVILPHDESYLIATFTNEHVKLLGMFDNRGQQWAHRILMALIGLFGLSVWYFKPFQVSLPVPSWLHVLLRLGARYGGLLICVPVIGMTLLRLKAHTASNLYIFQGKYAMGLIPSPWTQLALMALGAFAMYCLVASGEVRYVRRHERGIGVIAFAILISYVTTILLCGLLPLPDLREFTPGLLAGVEWHYSGSVASGDRLALGERLGEVPIHSGLFSSVILGYWQKSFGMLDMGSHIKFIGLLQLCFIVIIGMAYWIWYSGRWIPAILASLLTLPWVAPLHAAVLYPNQSAWRFLGFAIGMLALVCLHAKRLRSIAIPFGFVAGIALMWNLETGIALTITYAGFLILRVSSDSTHDSLAPILARFVFGIISAVTLFICLVRLAFGYWLNVIEVIQSFPLLSDFSSGYGGLKFAVVDPLAVLIFVHALYILVRGLMQWGSDAVMSARDSCQIAFAGLIVLWAAYYFKGPHFWNLWSIQCLYGFLLGTLIPESAWDKARLKSLAFVRSAPLMIVSLIIVPSVIAANLATVRSAYMVVHESSCLSEHIVSGVCLSRDLSAALLKKAAALQERNAHGAVVFLSANSYLMPLMTAIKQPLKERDAFSETIRKVDFARLIGNIKAIRPQCVLFDDPESTSSGYEFHRLFYGRVRGAIMPEYEKSTTENGWDAWCRRNSAR